MIELTRTTTGPGRDYSVSVKFTDLDDKMVSVAFDGRYHSTKPGSMMECFEYETYSDCPVIDEKGVQHKMVPDITAIRALRDALNRMNLGD